MVGFLPNWPNRILSMMGDEELDQISRVGVILAKLTAFLLKLSLTGQG